MKVCKIFLNFIDNSVLDEFQKRHQDNISKLLEEIRILQQALTSAQLKAGVVQEEKNLLSDQIGIIKQKHG